MSTHYIVQENIFVVIVYSVLEQQKQLTCHIKGCFKINGKERVKLPKKKANILDEKIMKEK